MQKTEMLGFRIPSVATEIFLFIVYLRDLHILQSFILVLEFLSFVAEVLEVFSPGPKMYSKYIE